MPWCPLPRLPQPPRRFWMPSPADLIPAADLADAAGIGRSTAGKLLAKLAAEGGVLRQPGGGQGGRPSADRWTLVASTPAAATQDRSTAPPTPTADAADPTQSRRESGRLGAGELRRLVLACLAERPDQALSPTAIAKTLGRSAGAVANALHRPGQPGRGTCRPSPNPAATPSPLLAATRPTPSADRPVPARACRPGPATLPGGAQQEARCSRDAPPAAPGRAAAR